MQGMPGHAWLCQLLPTGHLGLLLLWAKLVAAQHKQGDTHFVSATLFPSLLCCGSASAEFGH